MLTVSICEAMASALKKASTTQRGQSCMVAGCEVTDAEGRYLITFPTDEDSIALVGRQFHIVVPICAVHRKVLDHSDNSAELVAGISKVEG